jgi:Flp pilus assembly protein TadB
MWTTKAGMFGLGICVVMMTVGGFVMRQMINFDI